MQAFGKLLYRLGENIDLYSVSAHKIGGVRGIAALIRKKKCVLHPYIFGGGQEKGLRSGTENTFGIAQFALAAAAKYARLQENYRHAEELSSCVKNSLDKQIFKIISTGNCSPYIVSASARGLRGEVLLHMLDDKGVVVGTGSACDPGDGRGRADGGRDLTHFFQRGNDDGRDRARGGDHQRLCA